MSTSIPLPRLGIDLLSDETQMPAGTVRAPSMWTSTSADGFDPTRAATAEAAFTSYFGPRPDSDLRRATRSDAPQTNKVFWP